MLGSARGNERTRLKFRTYDCQGHSFRRRRHHRWANKTIDAAHIHRRSSWERPLIFPVRRRWMVWFDSLEWGFLATQLGCFELWIFRSPFGLCILNQVLIAKKGKLLSKKPSPMQITYDVLPVIFDVEHSASVQSFVLHAIKYVSRTVRDSHRQLFRKRPSDLINIRIHLSIPNTLFYFSVQHTWFQQPSHRSPDLHQRQIPARTSLPTWMTFPSFLHLPKWDHAGKKRAKRTSNEGTIVILSPDGYFVSMEICLHWVFGLHADAHFVIVAHGIDLFNHRIDQFVDGNAGIGLVLKEDLKNHSHPFILHSASLYPDLVRPWCQSLSVCVSVVQNGWFILRYELPLLWFRLKQKYVLIS